jgi:Tol biopolymer transport system component
MRRVRQLSLLWICVLVAIPILTAIGDSTSHARSPAKFLTSGAEDFWPCFSPDGTHILFSRHEGETWKLFVVPLSGGPPQQFARVPLSISATRANWAARTHVVAFTGTSQKGESGIWIIDGDGTNPHQLGLNGLSNQMFYPSWFPSGEQIAAMDAKNMVIKRIDVNTGAVSTITDRNKVLTGMPSVSPTGGWIAFAGQEYHGQKYDQTRNIIWIADESGIARPVEANPGQGRAPTWSPDGKRLAFESNRGSLIGLYAIFLINRDGTGLTQITDQDLNADHPVWSPDGSQLAFSARASMWTKDRSIALIEIPP